MERIGTNPNKLAKAGGFAVSAIYNYLSGASNTLSTAVLSKISHVTKTPVDVFLTGLNGTAYITVSHRIGAGGILYPMDTRVLVERPPGAPASADLLAAVIDEGGLHPLPSGWTVFYKAECVDPDQLIGKLAVIRWSGGGERPMVRTVRRGSRPGVFTLHALDGQLTEDVTVLAAHEVVCIANAPDVGGA